MFRQKVLITLLCCLFLGAGFLLGQGGQATSPSEAGTYQDPLVTESYLEERLKDIDGGKGVSFDGKTVIIATGEIPYDAQAAAPLSSREGAVLLLTRPGALSSSAQKVLEDLDPETVYIMGGEVAVSLQVEEEIGDICSRARVERVQGFDRYETAAEIARKTTGLR